MASGASLVAGAATAISLGSEAAGKWISRGQASLLSDARLRKMASRNDVMGGGKNSWQGKLISGELDTRFSLQESDKRIEDAVRGVENILKSKPNNITLNISVDQNGRVTSSSNDPNTSTRINLKRGNFFDVPFTD